MVINRDGTGAIDYKQYVNDTAGNDTINGGGGRDFVYGNGGSDLIEGGAEADVLDGGKDQDTGLIAKAEAANDPMPLAA